MKKNDDWKEGDWPADKIRYEKDDKVFVHSGQDRRAGIVTGETYMRGYLDYIVQYLSDGQNVLVNAVNLSMRV